MQYAAKTHIGLVRQLNEDGYAIQADLQPFGLAVVADGMGGHLAGEVASSLAVETVMQHILEQVSDASAAPAELLPAELLIEAMQQANHIVFERANSTAGLNGMGTTLIATLFDEQTIYLGHIGDSRAYLLQQGELRQLTDDHTLVNELYKNGQITAEEANHHPQRNIVTRAVGTDEHVQADLLQREWIRGDILLICSDGLTNMVSEQEMTELLQKSLPLGQKVDALINRALAAGGHDNITVVAVENDSERGDAR